MIKIILCNFTKSSNKATIKAVFNLSILRIMSNLKCAAVFATLVTMSGIFPETATAQTRYPNFLHSPLRVYGETSILNRYNYPRPTPVTPDDRKAYQEDNDRMALFSRASEEYNRENYSAAARVYVQIIQKYPRSAQAYFNLGVLLKKHSNNRETSIKCLRIAHKLFQQKRDRYMIEATERHLREY